MKTLFIEAKNTKVSKLPEERIRDLPKNIGLCGSIQYLDSIKTIKEQLESYGKSPKLLKGQHSFYEGQILGCDKVIKKDLDAFLYIGDGMFHPKILMLYNEKPVFSFNPNTGILKEIDKDEIKKIKIKQKVALSKFLSSKKIGVLVSTKPGQFRNDLISPLKAKYSEKEFYILISDTVDFTQLENFNFIECFVNTACPRLGLDDAKNFEKIIINLDEILLK